MATRLILLLMALLSWFASTAQESTFDPALAATLDSIMELDQELRSESMETREQFGPLSAEYRSLWIKINAQDSVNQLRVGGILNERGWLSVEEVGENGNDALFLVVQHSDLPFQQRYLPMLRDAVKQGKASAEHLAYLEDRVAIDQGFPQTYGTQMGVDNATGLYFLRPVVDPDHLDERRKSVGMIPIADYVSIFGITWDLAAYKQDLPQIQKILEEQE